MRKKILKRHRQEAGADKINGLQRKYFLRGIVEPGLSYAVRRTYKSPGFFMKQAFTEFTKLVVDEFEEPMRDYAVHRDELRAEAQRRWGREPFFEEIYNEEADYEIFGDLKSNVDAALDRRGEHIRREP